MEKDTRNAILVILIIVAGIAGAVFGSMVDLRFEGKEPPDPDEIERRDPTLYLTIGAAVATINMVIAVILIILYYEIYREVRSDFTLGLMLMMFSLLLYSIFANPLTHSIFGFRAFGIGAFSMIPHVFATIALSILLYLSLK